MAYWAYATTRHCRWCGIEYKATRPIGRDGFCSAACKQAHYRAYKKWVTAKCLAATRPADRKVTRKRKD
ncbi:hypothetical protein KAR91_35460 [Candidatus Pacearchaeota archaeon]|nr:hypothetical protein [Candidatus Pacearchaeota archaeon]